MRKTTISVQKKPTNSLVLPPHTPKTTKLLIRRKKIGKEEIESSYKKKKRAEKIERKSLKFPQNWKEINIIV